MLKILFCAFTISILFSQEVSRAQNGIHSSGFDTADRKREKNLDFDETLVEGISKNSSEFSSLISGGRNKDRTHLYQRTLNFDREMTESLRNLRYVE